MQDIPVVRVEFNDEIDLPPIPELGAYSIADALRGINAYYPSWKSKMLKYVDETKYLVQIELNGEFLCRDLNDLKVLIPYEKNVLKIHVVPQMAGDDLLNIGLGVGMLVAGISGVGVGFLGISATTVGLMGASLVFSSLFKHPKNDKSDKTDNTKKSINFSGVINTTGSGQVLPLPIGRDIVTGSIVASAQIVPYDASV